MQSPTDSGILRSVAGERNWKFWVERSSTIGAPALAFKAGPAEPVQCTLSFFNSRPEAITSKANQIRKANGERKLDIMDIEIGEQFTLCQLIWGGKFVHF